MSLRWTLAMRPAWRRKNGDHIAAADGEMAGVRPEQDERWVESGAATSSYSASVST